ncbi:MAG: aldehyde dehydrogenase family protein [Planctomycetota bacterium]
MSNDTSNPSQILETLDWGPAPEDQSAALEWIARSGETPAHFIGGEWTPSESGQTFPTKNPASGAVLRELASGTANDVAKAVEAAKSAQPTWQELGPEGRARHLYALARGIQKQSRLFAVVETLDNGKPIRETRDIDIPLVARHFYHHAGWAHILEESHPDAQPWGVCGQIIPWNFPLLMLAWKIAPALACGNTVVLKPAEWTSLSALLFAELCEKTGLPAGVVNIVTGAGETGAALVENPDVDKVAFTGSTEVGRIIREATAGSGKGLTLELGGKSPYILFEDADIDSAVEGLVDAIWFNQGQVCCAGSRLLVQESIAADVHARIEARMKKLRVGNPLDKAIDIGAIIDDEHLQRVEAMCERAQSEGIACIQPDLEFPAEGNWFPPTFFPEAPLSSEIATEEIFGPVLVSTTFRTPAEAIKIANHTRYGLAASVWSQDLDTALHVARKIKAGTVWVNGTNMFDASSGFGGMKESGFGREGGVEGLKAYLRNEAEVPGEPQDTPSPVKAIEESDFPDLDRTAKLWIGGKQVRADGGNSYPVLAPSGETVGLAALANRKDVRNAVEAAGKSSWAGMTGHGRAQVLWFIAENMESRKEDFVRLLMDLTGDQEETCRAEFEMAVGEWTKWASWADKHDGHVHDTPWRGLVLAVHEPFGTAAAICPNTPNAPLTSFVSMVAPLLAAGNHVVAVPSVHSLAAVEMCRVLEYSDLPAGALNLLTGNPAELAPVLAAHDAVDLICTFGKGDLSAEIERLSTGNMKVCWKMGTCIDSPLEVLDRASQIKNIWLPHGI